MATIVLVALCCTAVSASATVLETGPTSGVPGLPDGRVYEQVSPAVKNGNQAGAGTSGVNAYGVAAPDGDRILYWNSGPIGEASSGVDTFSVSARSPSGWSTRAALPQPAPEPRDPISSGDPVWMMPSTDLSRVTFTARDPFTPAPLDFASPTFSFASTYLSSEGAMATWLGEPTIENPLPPLEGVEEASDLVLVGASEDMSVVYYEYYGTLLPEDAPRRAALEAGNTLAWGLYEWRDGQLKAAGLLPPETPGGEEKEDEDGAAAAAVGIETLGALPSDFDNQVSRSGNALLFVSPSPEAGSGRPSQLYARVNGDRTVLISRSDLTGSASVNGVDPSSGLSASHLVSYAYGSPDGTHVFFASEEQLTADAPVGGALEEYQFDIPTNTLSYLPGIAPPILASSGDGSTLVFDDAESGENRLDMWSDGHVTEITSLPEPSSGSLEVAPVRLAGDDKTVVFQTNAPVSGFNDGEGFTEIYRYDLTTDGLSCVSCPPQGQSLVGSAKMSNDNTAHAVFVTADSRGVSEDGSEIFFDTPDSLVPQDQNGRRDVYEWHSGVVSLISPAGPGESLFLDNSASGSDVFVATTESLSSADTDGAYDVYDARVDGGFPAPAVSPPSCSADCGNVEVGAPIVPRLASTSLLGSGEQVLPTHIVRPPVVTRAQKLARSLKACKRKRGHSRRVCEAAARRRYGKHSARRAA